MISWKELEKHLSNNGVQFKQTGTTIFAYVAGGQPDQKTTIHLRDGIKTEFSESKVKEICSELSVPNM